MNENIIEEKSHSITHQEASLQQSSIPKALKHWSHEELNAFLSRKKVDNIKLTTKHDGAAIMKMSVLSMKSQLFDDRYKDNAERLFNLLRSENDRISKLQRKERRRVANDRKGKMI